MKSFGSWEHDLDGLASYMGPGLHKPLAPNTSRVIDEIVDWLGSDHT